MTATLIYTSIMGAFTVNYLFLLACVCACKTAQLKGNNLVRNFGIIGGQPIKIEDAPYVAQFRIKGADHYCGASIVHEQFLLTAGHCYNTEDEFYATVGTDLVNGGQDLEIEKMIRHPFYDKGGMSNNDVTVVKLKEKLSFNKKVQPIKMADPNIVIKDGANVTTLGFGVTESGDVSDKLLKVDVPVVNQETCAEAYHKINITDQEICAGREGKDSCQGDSGGPLVYQNTLIGIVSFGKGCALKGYPGVYARVSALRDFIDSTIKNNF